MKRYLRYNDELRALGSEKARWRVVELLPREGCIKLFDRELLVEVVKKLSAINQDIVEGKLILEREGTPKLSVAAQNDPKLDNAIKQALYFVEVIKAIQQQHGVSVNLAYKMAINDPQFQEGELSDPLPSRASIYRYIAAKRHDLPILKGDKNKGNRLPRYSDDIVDLICRAANTLYLVPGSPWTQSDLTEYVNDRARENGWLGASQTISMRFVLHVVFTNESVDPEIDRMDPKLVAAAKSKAPNRIVVTFPFERVEQDAVHLPFVVNTPHGEASNIYLIHAMCCCTGMVVGWHMMIGPPSESDGLKCVESILYSKESKFKSLGLSYDFDVYGTPQKLIFDNGPETKGERMAKLARLHIDVMHCKARHAHGKPFIERLNRSLKEAIQTLPGTTRFNGKDGQRDPVKLGDRLMSFDELHKWVVRWYFESWGNTVLKRHLRTEFREL